MAYSNWAFNKAWPLIKIYLSRKTDEPKQSVSIATPEFRPRRRSFKSIMKEDIFYTAPKRVNPLNVEIVEMKSSHLGKKRRSLLVSDKILVLGVFS